MELKAIKWALEKAGGNKTKAAELLNLKKSTFFERLKKYNLC
jgi:transcriptional regulator with PAS, ATPase and Fis domain